MTDLNERTNKYLRNLAPALSNKGAAVLLREYQVRMAKQEAAIDRLRGQLQNTVNHLDRAKRKIYDKSFDNCIEQANRALYETLIQNATGAKP